MGRRYRAILTLYLGRKLVFFLYLLLFIINYYLFSVKYFLFNKFPPQGILRHCAYSGKRKQTQETSCAKKCQKSAIKVPNSDSILVT